MPRPRAGHQPWWQRLFLEARTPSTMPVQAASVRRCPECQAAYGERDRYCPGCHSCVPEWRFG